MNVFTLFTAHVRSAIEALAAAGAFPRPPALERVVVEPPRDAAHGDLATNAAMALAKDAGLKPRDLALRLAAELGKLPQITKVEVAGPGFINMTLDPSVWRQALPAPILAGPDFCPSDIGASQAAKREHVPRHPT